MTPWQDIEKLEQAVEDFIHAYRMRHVRTTGGIRSGVPTRAEVTALNTALVNSRALPTPPVEGEDGLSQTSPSAHASSEAATDGLSNLDMVRAFHAAFDIPMLPRPAFPSPDRIAMRLRILDEERGELDDAIAATDLVEVADALTDMAYLVYGTALEFGIDLDPCFAEVHRSNMSKLGHDGKPIHREDGKVLKGPNYSPPNLAPLLALSSEPRS